jgi:hypothetical protein
MGGHCFRPLPTYLVLCFHDRQEKLRNITNQRMYNQELCGEREVYLKICLLYPSMSSMRYYSIPPLFLVLPMLQYNRYWADARRSTSLDWPERPKRFAPDEPVFNCDLEVCSRTVFRQASRGYPRMPTLFERASLRQPRFRCALSCTFHQLWTNRHYLTSLTLFLMLQSCLANNIHEIMWEFRKRYCTKCKGFMMWVDTQSLIANLNISQDLDLASPI